MKLKSLYTFLMCLFLTCKISNGIDDEALKEINENAIRNCLEMLKRDPTLNIMHDQGPKFKDIPKGHTDSNSQSDEDPTSIELCGQGPTFTEFLKGRYGSNNQSTAFIHSNSQIVPTPSQSDYKGHDYQETANIQNNEEFLVADSEDLFSPTVFTPSNVITQQVLKHMLDDTLNMNTAVLPNFIAENLFWPCGSTDKFVINSKTDKFNELIYSSERPMKRFPLIIALMTYFDDLQAEPVKISNTSSKYDNAKFEFSPCAMIKGGKKLKFDFDSVDFADDTYARVVQDSKDTVLQHSGSQNDPYPYSFKFGVYKHVDATATYRLNIIMNCPRIISSTPLRESNMTLKISR
jgi:hypothetical protein